MPSSKLHRATVVHHTPAGNGFHRLVLQAPALASAAVPGQFVMLRVSDSLDPLLARPFGISAVIRKRSIELYYQVVGRGTGLLTAAKTGSTLALHGPLGNGFPVPEKGTTPLLVAGGSGFPPLLYFASRHGKQALLFAGSRDRECLPPAAAMKDFRSRVHAVRYATEDGSKGTCGFVTDTLAAYLERGEGAGRPVIYACGPRAMLAAVSRLAAQHAVPCYVSMEERMACGLGVCMGCSIAMKAGGYKRACKEGPVFLSTEIDWMDRVVLPELRRK
ncbi:MAG: dihydroorotate dehydrogenase electron transfer subunit [Nitrospirota bacterium]